MKELLAERDAEAEEIIRKHVKVAMMGGAIPLPVVDLAAVSAVHVRMLRELAECYGATHDAGSARSFVTSVSGALAGMTVGRVAASLLKVLPGVGWTVGGLTQVIVTGASTFALGTLVKRLFRENRPLRELDFSTAREELASYFEAGRGTAEAILKRLKGPPK